MVAPTKSPFNYHQYFNFGNPDSTGPLLSVAFLFFVVSPASLNPSWEQEESGLRQERPPATMTEFPSTLGAILDAAAQEKVRVAQTEEGKCLVRCTTLRKPILSFLVKGLDPCIAFFSFRIFANVSKYM